MSNFVERRHLHQASRTQFEYILMRLGEETLQTIDGKKYNVVEWECTQCPECFAEMTLIGEEK